MSTVAEPVATVFAVSDVTQKILRNFASFNAQLLLTEGRSQHTHLKSKSILAVAELPEAWPKQTGIYNMNEFLGVLSTYAKPAIEFGDESLTLLDPSNPDKFTDYPYADPSVIGATEQRAFPHDNQKVEFTLSEADFASLKKNASLMSLLTVLVTVTKGKVALSAVGETGTKAWKCNIAAEKTVVHDPEFSKTLKFSVEHIVLLLDGDYAIRVAEWPYGYFAHKTMPVGYYVAQQKRKE